MTLSKGAVVKSAAVVQTGVKLCRDCKHSRFDGYSVLCGHPDMPPADLGSGELQFAHIVRKWGECGESGKLFEVRPPPAPRIPWHVRKLYQLSKWLERRAP